MSDLADLHVTAMSPERLAALRQRAASRLSGAAATKGSTASAFDALGVLHELASSPGTAPHALALLHELQVLQVELDLQAQELQESRADLESVLRRQVELHDFQPVGCFSIDAHLVLHELNQTGAAMLGIRRVDAQGLPLDGFFGGDGARVLRQAMARVDGGERRASCFLELSPRGAGARPVLANIGRDPAVGRYLLNLACGFGAPD
jgi:hypothetical protein